MPLPQKQGWKKRLLEPPLRPITKAVYANVVSLELMAARLRLPGAQSSLVPCLDDVTVLVKTFERPLVVERLLRSIRRLYPDLHIVVVDDSREPTTLTGVELVRLPFDSGVSAGRSAGLKRIKTAYTLVLDDDFVFHARTRLERPLQLLLDQPDIDLVGGCRVDLPFYRIADVRGRLWPSRQAPRIALGTRLGGLPVVDKTPNCFLARTERLRAVDWDPRVKRLDHADFFTRALGELVCVQDDRWSVLHAPTPFARHYQAYRQAVSEDRLYLSRKYARYR